MNVPIVNGAQGFIHKVIYMPGHKPPDLPDMILVKVDQYLGPSVCGDPGDKIVPIVPITRQWFKNKVSCTRTALPLVPSYSMTVHKLQGASLDRVIANLGEKEFALGLAYTALSHCKTLEQLYFEEMPPQTRLTNHFSHQLFKKKLKEEKRLKEVEESTISNADIADVLTEEEDEIEDADVEEILIAVAEAESELHV